MLGRFHGSVEHLYVPRLIHLKVKVPIGSQVADRRQYNLFKLGWDSVDKFKQDTYVKWVEKHWKEQFPIALKNSMPGTLPPRYDEIITNLVFAIPHDYQVAIQHYTQLYYAERHRVWKFDTCIRDLCLKTSEVAIGTAFKLLADCCYDDKAMGWLRHHPEVDKRLIGSLLRYKFWRESTGRGLVWDHAGLDELDRFAGLLLQKGHSRQDTELGTKYRRCLTDIKQWEMDEEKFRNFIGAGGPTKLDPNTFAGGWQLPTPPTPPTPPTNLPIPPIPPVPPIPWGSGLIIEEIPDDLPLRDD